MGRIAAVEEIERQIERLQRAVSAMRAGDLKAADRAWDLADVGHNAARRAWYVWLDEERARPGREGLGMKRTVAVLAFIAAAILGCNQSPTVAPPAPTSTPAPACPFSLKATAVAGFAAVYFVEPDPPGRTDVYVNATVHPLDFGVLLQAVSGDTVSACRPCGCTVPYVLK